MGFWAEFFGEMVAWIAGEALIDKISRRILLIFLSLLVILIFFLVVFYYFK